MTLNGSREREQLITNLITSRAELVRSLVEGGKDLDRDCGYPGPEGVNSLLYQRLYDREAVATRVVEVYPKESWQVQPTLYEDEDPDKVTPFEEAWDDLGRTLRGETSYHQDEAGSPLWEYLVRADILSGIGQYGVILLGLDDGLPLHESAQLSEGVETVRGGVSEKTGGERRGGKGSRKLTFVRIFPESVASVSRFNEDVTSPRFGQPEEYTLIFASPVQGTGGVGGTTLLGGDLPTNSALVHWSRVIHVADNLAANEVFGVPRMQPVLNRLLDLRKLYGGSAEMYWKGAFPGYVAETYPQLGTEVYIDENRFKEQMRLWADGLQRYIQSTGMSIKGLSPQVVDPSPQIERQIEAICIQLGVPVRVFKGSERGELASSQDDAAWNDRLRQRQAGYLTPRLIVPFCDRLIQLGVLPRPSGYSIWWPDLTSQSEQEKVTIATGRTEAITKYADSEGAKTVMAPMDFLTRVLGYSEEEATAIVENAEEMKEQMEEEAKEKAEEERKAQAEAMTQQKELAEAQARANGSPEKKGEGDDGQDAEGNTDKGSDDEPPRGGSGGTRNVFCPTGSGGGVDPSCSSKHGGSANEGKSSVTAAVAKHVKAEPMTKEEKVILAEAARTQSTLHKSLVRISRTDPRHRKGDVVDLDDPTSTTSLVDDVLAGKAVGNVGWKYSDKAIYLIEGATHGVDVNYKEVGGRHFSAAGERETIVAGRYLVKEVRRITEPGTRPQDDYKVTAYVLKELEPLTGNRRTDNHLPGKHDQSSHGRHSTVRAKARRAAKKRSRAEQEERERRDRENRPNPNRGQTPGAGNLTGFREGEKVIARRYLSSVNYEGKTRLFARPGDRLTVSTVDQRGVVIVTRKDGQTMQVTSIDVRRQNQGKEYGKGQTIRNVVNHLPGKHDQSSHGKHASVRSRAERGRARDSLARLSETTEVSTPHGTFKVSPISDPREVHKALERVLGKGKTLADAVRLTGAEGTGTVYFGLTKGGGLSVFITSKDYDTERHFLPGGRVRNEGMILNEEAQGKGLGSRMFERQVGELSRAGFKRIETEASRSQSLVGYKVWPKMGYDGKIPDEVKRKLPDSLRKARRVSDLMKTAEGREWWKENGVSTEMVFELRPGSRSRQVLAAYQSKKVGG